MRTLTLLLLVIMAFSAENDKSSLDKLPSMSGRIVEDCNKRILRLRKKEIELLEECKEDLEDEFYDLRPNGMSKAQWKNYCDPKLEPLNNKDESDAMQIAKVIRNIEEDIYSLELELSDISTYEIMVNSKGTVEIKFEKEGYLIPNEEDTWKTRPGGESVNFLGREGEQHYIENMPHMCLVIENAKGNKMQIKREIKLPKGTYKLMANDNIKTDNEGSITVKIRY